MKQSKETTQPKEQPYLLRQRIKRIEQSRDSVKSKSRELAKSLKAKQKREVELIDNRDSWKTKCKKQMSENEDLKSAHRKVAEQLQITEEQLQQILDEFNELKKKHHKGFGKNR